MKPIQRTFFSILLCLACSNVPDCLGDDVLDTSPERSVRHVNLSFSFSDELVSPQKEDFDVFGLSIGAGIDLLKWRMYGLQMAGILAGAEDFRGIQLGLVCAFSERGFGIQLSPVSTFGGNSFYGIQAGPFCSIASGAGVQLSFLVNGSDDCFNLGDRYRKDGRKSEWAGMQLAGICNRACFLYGVQASFCYNYAVKCRGIQLAPWNDADELHGIQIGLINEARSGTGVQIGLFNFFGDGDDRLLLPIINARF